MPKQFHIVSNCFWVFQCRPIHIWKPVSKHAFFKSLQGLPKNPDMCLLMVACAYVLPAYLLSRCCSPLSSRKARVLREFLVPIPCVTHPTSTKSIYFLAYTQGPGSITHPCFILKSSRELDESIYFLIDWSNSWEYFIMINFGIYKKCKIPTWNNP